jgi:hypothetical protein
MDIAPEKARRFAVSTEDVQGGKFLQNRNLIAAICFESFSNPTWIRLSLIPKL